MKHAVTVRVSMILAVVLATVADAAPRIPITVDVQAPARKFKQQLAAGSSPILSAYVYDGGRAFTNLVNGYTGYLYIAVTPTAGVFVTASGFASNRADFSFAASQTATVGTYQAEIVLGDGTNTYRWGSGTLVLSNSPALLGAGTLQLTGVLNWDLYSYTGTMPAQPVTYTNALGGDLTGYPESAQIAAGAVGTNELDAQVRGQIASASAWSTTSVHEAHGFAAPYPGYATYSASTNLLAAIFGYEQNLGSGNYYRYGGIDLWSITTGSSGIFRRVVADTTGLQVMRGVGGTLTTVWDAGNDGAGSGLDAGLFAGNALSNFLVRSTSVVSQTQVYGPFIAESFSGPMSTTTTPTIIEAGGETFTGSGTGARRLKLRGGYDVSAEWGIVDVGDTNTAGATMLGRTNTIRNGVFSGDGANVSNVNAVRVGGYLPTDFALVTSLTNYLRPAALPVASTSTVAPNTYTITNGYLYLHNPNILGAGTNSARIQLTGW